ncbi:Uncharacterised protein [Candidatus Burarchaeum australiense]|nr:Uncharacterised protein [Candidatus Burarchaeum australiense]
MSVLSGNGWGIFGLSALTAAGGFLTSGASVAHSATTTSAAAPLMAGTMNAAATVAVTASGNLPLLPITGMFSGPAPAVAMVLGGVGMFWSLPHILTTSR